MGLQEVVDAESARCKKGASESCDHVLTYGAELDNINSELALQKLRNRIQSEQLKALVDDAITKLDGANHALDDVADKIDTPLQRGITHAKP